MTIQKSIHSKSLTTNDYGFPTKIYVFGSYIENIGDERAAYNLVRRTLREHPEIEAEPHVTAIAFPYGFVDGESVEGIDIFAARLRSDGWNGNAMYDSWTFENGVYVPREKGTSCGDSFIIVAEEEKFRRATKDREIYAHLWPDIGGLI